LQCRKLRRSTQQDTTTIAHLTSSDKECCRRRLSATPASAFVVWLRRCDKNDATRPGGRPGPARPGPVDRRATRSKLLPLTSFFLKMYYFFIYLLENYFNGLNLDFFIFYF
jgi:hypothetical protein